MTTIINTRIYLRASTIQQDAFRAEEQLYAFAKLHNLNVVDKFVENESGASLDRLKLFELISKSSKGDILLCESTDRLTRLTASKWAELKKVINDAGIRLVIADLPTSYQQLSHTANNEEDVTTSVMRAINNMIVDIMAAMANKDYEQRKARAAQGRKKAKEEGKLKGRKEDTATNTKVMKYLREGKNSWGEIVVLCDCSRAQVAKLAKRLKEEDIEG